MKELIKNILTVIVLTLLSTSAESQINVRKCGAKGDGKSFDTRAIQKAIDQSYNNGGGIVEIPAGKFLIGTIILKDNVGLHLQPGAVLLGSSDYRDYAEIIHKYDSRTNGLYAKHFMVFAEGAKNISITGTGTIHGNGLEHFLEDDPQNQRPFMIRLVNCENVTIRDVKLLESANWTLHLLGCRDVNVDGIVIENHTDANRDGLDIDACNRVTVSNSRFLTGDDAIVMKASNDTLCQNISITNCIIRTNASAIKTGTESNGGFRNITVSNCVIKDLPRHAGIELMTVDGGVMENIVIENITMENVATPIFIRLGNRARPFKSGQYVNHLYDVKDIYLNNIIVLDAKLPSSIIGMNAKPVQNILISNYSVRSVVAQKPVPYNQVPFEEFSYPAASVFKNLPAYGFYCRNVDGLRMKNINLYSAEDEIRPAFVFDRINNLELSSVKAEIKSPDSFLAYFRNSKNAAIQSCSSTATADFLFAEEEGTNSNIRYTADFLQAGQNEVKKMPLTQDLSSFEDFDTDIKYILGKGIAVKGLVSHNLKESPLKFSLDISKKGSLQLCMLLLNDSHSPAKVTVKYEGVSQEYEISWNEWGWAPLTLLKEYPSDRKVDFEILQENKDSDLKISGVYLRYQDVKKTD
jgi:hypothetical protein